MEYRQAEPQDIPQVASLFLAAFAPSVKHFLGRNLPSQQSIRDIFTFIHKAEPKSFFVASDTNKITGYLIASRDIRSVWLKAITQGDAFLWLFRWISGRYGIGTGPIKTIIRHKLLYLTSKHNYRSTSQAQILSIAIDQDCQNQGIARNLLALGLRYLSDVKEIKLEVRPQNIPALCLYKSHGFQPVATTSDSQGDWLVMVKKK